MIFAKPNFVHTDLYNIAQTEVTIFLLKFPKMRNIHGPNVRFFIPNIILANCIAKAANATILANYQKVSKSKLQIYPSILPAVQISDTHSRTVQYIWSKYRNKSVSAIKTPELPTFVQITPTHLQFTYCDDVRKKTENIWNLTLFTNCFDWLIWLAIGCVLVGMSIIQLTSTWVFKAKHLS